MICSMNACLAALGRFPGLLQFNRYSEQFAVDALAEPVVETTWSQPSLAMQRIVEP